jgi:hypothetical protein
MSRGASGSDRSTPDAAVILCDLDEREANLVGLVHVFGDLPLPHVGVPVRWRDMLAEPGSTVRRARIPASPDTRGLDLLKKWSSAGSPDTSGVIMPRGSSGGVKRFEPGRDEIDGGGVCVPGDRDPSFPFKRPLPRHRNLMRHSQGNDRPSAAAQRPSVRCVFGRDWSVTWVCRRSGVSAWRRPDAQGE